MDKTKHEERQKELEEHRAKVCKASRYQKYSALLGACWELLPTETDKRVQYALESVIEVVANKMGFEIIDKWMGDLKATETTDEPAESEGGADE